MYEIHFIYAPHHFPNAYAPTDWLHFPILCHAMPQAWRIKTPSQHQVMQNATQTRAQEQKILQLVKSSQTMIYVCNKPTRPSHTKPNIKKYRKKNKKQNKTKNQKKSKKRKVQLFLNAFQT